MPAPRPDRGAERPTSASFATRLQGLYSARKLEKRPPYTDPAVARAVSEITLERIGKRYRPQYLNQLRRGLRTQPRTELVEALAEVFGVPVAHFYDKNAPAKAAAEPAPPPSRDQQPSQDQATLSPEAIRIGLRASGLSQHWQLAVLEFIEHARNADGLADDAETPH